MLNFLVGLDNIYNFLESDFTYKFSLNIISYFLNNEKAFAIFQILNIH